jgi:hypothetical protein
LNIREPNVFERESETVDPNLIVQVLETKCSRFNVVA